MDVPNTVAILFVSEALFVPLLFKLTAPLRLLLAFVKAIAPAPALTVTAPALAAWVMEPTCETPTPVKLKVPEPTLEVPILNAPVFATATLFAPLFDNDTAPVKAFAPALKLDVPGTVMTPVWVIAPPELIVKF